MENEKQHSALTASEISSLWTSFQEDTLNICGINYFLKHVDDHQIREVLEQSLALTEKRKKREIQFFEEENHPLPHGFTEQDVNLNAPRLFSDKLYLEYIINMTSLNFIVYGSILPLVDRSDVVTFYSECLTNTQILHKEAKELAKEKGINIRVPHIPKQNHVDYVKKDRNVSG